MVYTDSKIDYAALVVAFRTGDLSLSKFCEKHNVSTTTMNYYLYGKSKKKKEVQ